MNLKIIAIILATALLFIPGVLAWGCSVVNITDCPQTSLPLFYLSGSTNVHAANQSGSYSYVVCCGKSVGPVNVSSPSSGIGVRYNNYDVVLWLSGGTNAHVEHPNTIYTIPIYIAIDGKNWTGAVNCSNFSTCPAGFGPVVSISNYTNAHVANATGTGSYSTKICCKIDPDLEPPSTNLSGAVNGSTYISPLTFELTCNDTKSGCNVTYWCNTTGSTCTPSQIYTRPITLALSCTDCSQVYTVKAYSTDRAGNVELTKTFVFNLTDTAPGCNWTTIPPAYINFTQFTVGGNAMYIKQGESIVRYELVWTVNNQTNATNITSSNPDFSYTFTGRDGMRYKNIKCRVITDQREGIWSNPIESVLVDTTPPNASITKPEQEEVTLVAGKFLVAWSGTDSGSGIDKYDVQKSDDGVAWDYWKTGTNLTQDNFTASAGQTWHFRVRAIDKAGNVGNWSTEKIVSVIGEVQVNWSFIPSTGIIKTGENITIKAAIYSDTDILNVTESYEGNVTNITKNITQISGKRWNVSWMLIEPESGKNQTFRITIKDVNNHSIKRETKFSVVVCMPNENRTCCRGVNGTVCQSSTYQNTICTFGTSVCTSSYEWGSCSGIGPSIEICDSKDNDCDGEIDEGINCQCTPNTTRFICPWGHCNTTGLAEGTYNFESWCLAQEQRCNASGLWGTPTGGRGPRQETCNGIDDDCDGETDDGNPQCCTPEGAERMYGLQDQSLNGIGICKIGIDKCQNGQWVTIQTPQAPTSEICDNSADDDCDGKTDVQDEDCQGWGFEFPWWIFVGLGVGVLVALIVLWIWFRKKGTDLTWENLIKKWTPTE